MYIFEYKNIALFMDVLKLAFNTFVRPQRNTQCDLERNAECKKVCVYKKTPLCTFKSLPILLVFTSETSHVKQEQWSAFLISTHFCIQ